MNQPELEGLPVNRRECLKRLGVSTAALTAAMHPATAQATNNAQASELSLDVILGYDPVLGGWQEFDDYHDIENNLTSRMHPRLRIQGESDTYICVSAVLPDRAFPSSSEYLSIVDDASGVHEEQHGYTTGFRDGPYSLYAAVIDVETDSLATETVDFTVR